jgi:hypothetical protein
VTWREQDHPRDRRGRFADKSDWASAVSGRLGGHGHRKVEGRDLVADGWVEQNQARLDRGIAAWGAAGYPYGDPVLKEVAAEQGFDGLPAVGTPEELDAAVAAGGVDMWRGYYAWVESGDRDERRREVRRMQAEWREGEYKAGSGLYGQGVYTSVSDDTAIHFSIDRVYDAEGVPPSVQRMVLLPGARVIDWDAPELGVVDGLRSMAWHSEERPHWDRGRLAAALGYDAMRVPEGEDDGAGVDATQYVIFNRTALMVEQERT